MKRTIEKTVRTFGEYGATIRVVKKGDYYRVRSRHLGLTRSFKGADAKARALGFAERLAQGRAGGEGTNTSIAALWDAYTSSSAFRELRPRSRELYAENWSLFCEVVPHHTPADEVTVAVLEVVRTALTDTPRPRAPEGLAVNTVRKAIQVVKGVFAWGERVEFLSRNRVHGFTFRVGRDNRPVTPDEYTGEEYTALLAALSFDKVTQRTPFVITVLCGSQGVRINAALHLRWEDVRWDDDVILWRAAWDKMGNEWDQPLRTPTRAVLARLWDAADNPTEGWVFPSRRTGAASETYTVQSYWWALREAEKRAEIPHRARRAAHGFRRMIAGDLVDATGSAHLAMEGIGDRSVKMAETYVKRRTGRTARALKELDRGVA